MSYENIQFKRPNMVFADGYFYCIDEFTDTLLQKLSDGVMVFMHPLDTTITQTVNSLEHDGVNFWSLQNYSSPGIVIKRWHVENGICAFKDEFIYTNGATHNYDSDTFTIEHYHTVFSTSVSGNSDTIYVNNHYDTVISGSSILTLGPNEYNEYEDVTVSTTSGNAVILDSNTQYAYNSGDKVNLYTNLWLFNNYDGLNNTGALYKFDAHTGNYIEKFGANEYKDITACTFNRINNVFSSDVDALIYVKSTNIKFVNIETLANYGTMVIDNLKVDQSTVITVYDMVICGDTIYRLQKYANYYEVDISWHPNYNYQVSTTRSFIDSITVNAYPLVVPSNGANTIEITAIVLDQYGNGVVGKPVNFIDNDDVGYITIDPAFTDYFFGTGKAISYYKAGLIPKQVTIEGIATQYD